MSYTLTLLGPHNYTLTLLGRQQGRERQNMQPPFTMCSCMHTGSHAHEKAVRKRCLHQLVFCG